MKGVKSGERFLRGGDRLSLNSKPLTGSDLADLLLRMSGRTGTIRIFSDFARTTDRDRMSIRVQTSVGGVSIPLRTGPIRRLPALIAGLGARGRPAGCVARYDRGLGSHCGTHDSVTDRGT